MHSKRLNNPADSIKLVKKVIRYLIMFFGFLVILFGIVPFFIYFNVSKVSREQGSWKETAAKVTAAKLKSAVQKLRVYDEVEEEYATVETTEYSPEIEYEYVVNGKEYTATRFKTLGYSSESEVEVKKLVAKYPVGSKCKIYYNPSNHEDAAIEKNSPPSKMILAFGVLIVFFGLFIILVISRLAVMGVDLILASNPKLLNPKEK